MIVLGIILLLIAVMSAALAALWGVGIIALSVGMVLAVCGAMGQAPRQPAPLLLGAFASIR